ncbi:hypothetical protein PG997_006605 [Apiospora hydei]|uniref:Uncharacterized protein n=1 Tax=Apiospora hydei TaxID=1337664 RepID=A0ABR1WPA0_9PEZI
MPTAYAGKMRSNERPLAPCPRDPSPSSSGATMAAQSADWPLASENSDATLGPAALERPKTRRSYTSQAGHRTPVLLAGQALNSHPIPEFPFHRPVSAQGQVRGGPIIPGAHDSATAPFPGRSPAPSRSTAPSRAASPAASPARPPTRFGMKRSFNSMGSISSESASNDAPIGPPVRRETSTNRIMNGLATGFSRGAQVFSSAGSFFPFMSESPSKTRISAPYDFRHVASAEHGGGPMGGVDPGPDADPEATLSQTHRVLLDVRTDSRIHNRTSLPVAMPNVTSPIDESQFDAGCGHDSNRNSFNPFPSQTVTPATVQVHRPDQSPVAQRQHTCKMPSLAICHTIKALITSLGIALSVSILAVCITSFSTVSAITSMVLHSDENKVVSHQEAVWLTLSVGLCFTSMVAVAITYARRRTSRVATSHRNSQREEEMIELQNIIRHRISTPTRIRNSDPAIELDDMTQRRTSEAVAVGQNERALRLSGSITTPEPVHIRQSSRIVAQGLNNLAAPPNSIQSKRASGIFDAESVRTALCAQSVVEARRVAAAPIRTNGTPIGVARSDSLLRSIARRRGVDTRRDQQQEAAPSEDKDRAEDRNRSHSAESGNTVRTYESTNTETPMITVGLSREIKSSHSPQQSEHSKDVESLASSSDNLVSARIPHSVAVPDLSSETKLPAIPAVDTNSTLASLISSYADNGERAPTSQDAAGASYTTTYSAPRPQEALGSHPVPRAGRSNNPFRRLMELPRPPQQIVTESGTPDSQKSTERFPAYVDPGVTQDNDNTYTDTSGRRRRMTTIKERGEPMLA